MALPRFACEMSPVYALTHPFFFTQRTKSLLSTHLELNTRTLRLSVGPRDTPLGHAAESPGRSRARGGTPERVGAQLGESQLIFAEGVCLRRRRMLLLTLPNGRR